MIDSSGGPNVRLRVSNGAVIDRELIDRVAHIVSMITDEPASAELLESGVSSSNLFCRSGRRSFVARVELYRSRADLEADFAFAKCATLNGVHAVPPPVWIGQVGPAPISIRPWIAGIQADLREMTPSVARQAGVQLARVHTAEAPLDRTWFYDSPLRDPHSLVLPDRPLVARALGCCTELAADSVLVHSDYRSANWIVAGPVLHVLDWEKAAVGPRLFDLGLAAFHISAWPGPTWSDLLTAFLQGYASESRHEQSGELIEAIVTAGCIFYLVDAEIFRRTRETLKPSSLDMRHSSYFLRYCEPAISRLLSRVTELSHQVQTATQRQ